MNKVFPRDTIYVTTIGLSQIAGAQFLNVYGPRQWINCGQAGPLGWTIPAALGVVAADPARTVVVSGDYDFQFLIEELAVGVSLRLPYVQVLVNNSYLGLIRQSQRGFEMDYCMQLAFENQNVEDPGLKSYGVDHQAVQGLGCKSLRVTDPRIERPWSRPGDWHKLQRAGGGGGDPGEGHQHRHGHRDRQDQRVRRPWTPSPKSRGARDGRLLEKHRFASQLDDALHRAPRPL